MVSREEYKKYVKKLIEKNKEIKMKSLSIWYLFGAMLSIVFGAFMCCFSAFQLLKIYYLHFNYRIQILFIIGAVLIAAGIVMIKIRQDTKKVLRTDVKKSVIKYLLKDYWHWFMGFGYMEEHEFKNSQFGKTFDCFSSYDTLNINVPNNDGSKSNVYFKISDVYTYNRVFKEDGTYVDKGLYEGVFGYVTFKKAFKCILAINSKFKIKGIKFEDVILEDINFNEKFKVLTDNQIEARYILTPDMMEKLSLLEEKLNGIKIVLVDRKLYLGVPKYNMFEMKNYDKDDELAVFDNLYDEIQLVLSIVEELKNNDKVFKM